MLLKANFIIIVISFAHGLHIDKKNHSHLKNKKWKKIEKNKTDNWHIHTYTHTHRIIRIISAEMEEKRNEVEWSELKKKEIKRSKSKWKREKKERNLQPLARIY